MLRYIVLSKKLHNVSRIIPIAMHFNATFQCILSYQASLPCQFYLVLSDILSSSYSQAQPGCAKQVK